MKKHWPLILNLLFLPAFQLISQVHFSATFDYNLTDAKRMALIRPIEIDDVLMNPGMGFMTFQRFNGDDLNKGSGWTEGLPIEYQPFDGDLTNKDHPATTIAYWRVYWKYLEPEKGKYRWDMIDKALELARLRGQTLLIRVAPHGGDPNRVSSVVGYGDDLPEWYVEMAGRGDGKYFHAWKADANNPLYSEHFGMLIRAMGKRYDGHPDLEAVDLSIVGNWGEGGGSEYLTKDSREALVKAYTDVFRKTPLIPILMDPETNSFAQSQRPVGWRVDCLGNLRIWGSENNNNWDHMRDKYPIEMISHGLQDNWKKAPVSFEICGTFTSWKTEQKITREEVKYIFNEALKWHVSSFNAKSSPVPAEWQDLVDDWLKRMGYRFVLRSFGYPKTVERNGKLPFYSLWENIGVAPCYKDFVLAVRIKSGDREEVLITNAHTKNWMPGDFAFDDFFFVPHDFPLGTCDLQIAIVDKQKRLPRINLAIEGKQADGWYQIGKINIAPVNF